MHKELPLTPPVTGLVAGKYELCGLIGRGGMGSVWEGRHVTLATRVAIKFIEAEYADSVEARQRFDNEARAAATLQSRHAIQIFDHGVSPEGKPYIVMEMLSGEPLDKRIERLGRMSLSDVTRFIQQVCKALVRAHDKGIIHRDLKPENIFLVRTPDEDDEIAKVLDFGIAKFAQPAALGISSGTKTGAVLGTPFYMSPEQARGLRSIDHRSDLWSLGVIAYKCLTGQLPFDGESVGDLLVKICVAPLPVPSHLVPELPPQFDEWFARALEREPDRRFSSAAELSEALGRAAGGRTLPPRAGLASLPDTAGAPWQGGAPSGSNRSTGAPQISQNSQTSQTPLAAAATQAPFTATGRPTVSTRRGVVFATIGAALLGLSGGVLGVAKLWGRGGESTVPGSGLSPGASPVGASLTTLPAEPVQPAASASASPSATPSGPRPTSSVVRPQVVDGRGPPRPPVLTVTPVTPVTPAPSQAPVGVPPAPKPKPDPGY